MDGSAQRQQRRASSSRGGWYGRVFAVTLGAASLIPMSRPADALGGIAPRHACIVNWTVPEAPGTGVLFSVAALSANNVWAVGQDNSTGYPLIEHWNGSRGQGESSPALPVGGGRGSVFSLGAR